jgi:Fe-S cluster assembly ATP-binding protein
MALEIKNYTLKIEELDKQILENVDLKIRDGEIIVLVGENGSGKTSFAMSLIGLPGYARNGSIKLNDVETIESNIDEIAKAGLFVSFQSPPEIDGLSLFNFISTAYRSLYGEGGLSSFKLRKKILEVANLVGLNETFLERSTNQGFSGGERRKSEVLQMLVLEPKVAILDEVDSGLDIKSTHKIARILREKASEGKMSIIVISHSPEFIKKLSPNRIIELKGKKLVEVSMAEVEKFEDEAL